MNKKPTAADTWDREPINRDKFDALFACFLAHPDYEVRPALQSRHHDSTLVKIIETEDVAHQTLANLRGKIIYAEEPFADLSERQVEILSEVEFAVESRKEVQDFLRD